MGNGWKKHGRKEGRMGKMFTEIGSTSHSSQSCLRYLSFHISSLKKSGSCCLSSSPSKSLLAVCPGANCLPDVKLLHLFSKDCFFSAYTVPNCQIKEINNNFILFFVCPHPSVIEFKILRECFKEKRLQKFFRDLYVIVIGSKRTINEHKMQEKQPSARSEFVL